TFDEARSKEAAEDFVREVLVDGIGARLVVVGADFHFGHRRGGNVPLLERMGAELGFEVLGLGLVAGAGDPTARPYSSTRIPELLPQGDGLGEAYVLDFDGDLYGQRVKVRFREWVRGQERFDSTEALVEQMNADVEVTRRILAV